MKKVKVKLMRQMRDEASRNKMRETKMSQKMESVIKENRKKEIALKRMKDEKKQRDLVMKRKQQEVRLDILLFFFEIDGKGYFRIDKI